MDKGSSNHKSHRDAKEEADLHVPLINRRVAGEPMVVWVLMENNRERDQTRQHKLEMVILVFTLREQATRVQC